MSAAQQKGRYLSELLAGIATVPSVQDCLISGLQLDSRKVSQGDCFLAMAGTVTHGVDYIESAMTSGAVVVLMDPVDRDLITSEEGIIFVDGLSALCGVIAHRFYGERTQQIKTFGVTGTNGKTSVSYFIAQALDELEGKNTSGVIGTLGNGLLNQATTSGMTTPDPVELHKTLAGLVEQGGKSVVIEASSHGLAQDRLSGVNFDVAIFTNLTRDHLDYHGDMQSYGEAKQKLFKNPDLKGAVINLDDSYSAELLAAIPESVAVLGYSLNSKLQADPQAKQIPMITCLKLDVSLWGLQLYVETPYGSGTLTTNLLGRFNASNLLAALGALLISGVHVQQGLNSLSMVNGVKGRMEAFSQDKSATVVVDYAHTPDGLNKALTTLREVCRGQLWCVFGCGGDRDKGKRPLMGATVEQAADRLVITNDNPRSEDPALIAEEIMQGLQKPEQVQVVLDRREAIEMAMSNAGPEDIILVAGKGHEDWQEIKGQRFPFNDRNVVLNAINDQIDHKGNNENGESKQ